VGTVEAGGRWALAVSIAGSIAIPSHASAAPNVALDSVRMESPAAPAAPDGARSSLLTRRDLVLASVVAAAVFGAGENDGWLRSEAREDDSNGQRLVARFVQPLGNGGVVVTGLALCYVGARVAHESEWAGKIGRVALCTGAAGAAAIGLKEITGRSRPTQAPDDADEMRPFSGHDSFPSGHTTIAFALAAATNYESHRPWLPWITYPVAALVGWSRVHDDRHWTSDVVAGAALGVWTARRAETVIRAHAGRWPHFAVAPWSSSGGAGLAVQLRN